MSLLEIDDKLTIDEGKVDSFHEFQNLFNRCEERLNKNQLDISKTTYLALFTDKESSLQLYAGLLENKIDLKFNLQTDPHVTLSYFGYKGNPEYDLNIIGNAVPVEVIAYGEYKNPETGVLENTGLLVKPKFLDIPLDNGQKVGEFVNNIDGYTPHITLGVSRETDEKGQTIAKAVNTDKCEWKELNEPFVLDLRLGAFSKGNAYIK